MKRSLILLLMVLDLAFIGALGYMTWMRYGELRTPPPVSMPVAVEPALPPTLSVVESTVPVQGMAVDGIIVSTSIPAVLGEPVEVSTAAPVAVDLPVISTVPSVTVSTSPVASNAVSRRTFRYFNKTARTVHLVGDFNKWAPQSFRRNSRGAWLVSVSLSPGDYSYNFIVDGRTIRDPNQKRTDSRGRSLLTVPSAAN